MRRPTPRGLDASLADGLQRIGVACPSATREQLVAYLILLCKWNRAYNLTGVRDAPEMVERHVLDSLSVLPWVYGGQLLDVGSGAGLPGMLLAIARPEMHCVLLDASTKKTRFMQQAVFELGLNNVDVARARIEDYRPPTRFTTVVSRAALKLGRLLRDTREMLERDGRVLSMQGTVPRKELAELALPARTMALEPLSVPNAAARHLIIVAPSGRLGRTK